VPTFLADLVGRVIAEKLSNTFFGGTGILPVITIGEQIDARNDGQDARPTRKQVASA
jgi:hypothetical protein